VIVKRTNLSGLQEIRFREVSDLVGSDSAGYQNLRDMILLGQILLCHICTSLMVGFKTPQNGQPF
jgi:hypothetical protein